MSHRPWWQDSVFYQIYVRSFADGNGDGVGDLAGMIGKLDYLKDLGIDALWLSPHYPSPLLDCGYDISDYVSVAPEYGTLDDFRRFLDGAHRRGLHVILDLVLNHTSDQHRWFLESRSSRDDPRRAWYIWHDGAVGGGPPNNWYSTFGGSAWEWDERTGQYYYHFYLRQQPDLNWRNPEVKAAMWEAARFWLRLGVDGFRLDAIDKIYEDDALPDHRGVRSQAEQYRAWRSAGNIDLPGLEADRKLLYVHQRRQPGLHGLMRELRRVVDEFPDKVLVGESDDLAYCGDGTDEVHLVFNFPLVQTGRLTPAWVRANQAEQLGAMPPTVWPCNSLNNHDSSRVYSRFGDDEHDGALARLHFALLLTLRGTPFLYNGEEIGMTDYLLSDAAQFRDVVTLGILRLETDEFGTPPRQALAFAGRAGRDKSRTPFQWSGAPNGGFSPPGVRTWLPVNPNHADGVNVADQEHDPASLLSYYRRLLAVRQASPALVDGCYSVLHPEACDYLAYLRRSTTTNQTCVVVLNFAERPQTITLVTTGEPSNMRDPAPARLLFSSHPRPAGEDDLLALRLAPFEAYIAELA